MNFLRIVWLCNFDEFPKGVGLCDFRELCDFWEFPKGCGAQLVLRNFLSVVLPMWF
jgi:hypothetical protein